MKIGFQGALGAYSDLSCRAVYPDAATIPCASFEDVFDLVREGGADVAMIPVENSIAGRVADNHHLLPNGGLHIVGEYYQPVVHHLLALPGTKISDIKFARSHMQGLMQCRNYLRERNIVPVNRRDTAGSAEEVAKLGDQTVAAIASELAGKIYGLESLATDIADQRGNTTRFLILKKKAEWANADPLGVSNTVTTLLFRVRSVPAALYKALGGFATNGVNITKLESYLVDGRFTAAQFYLDAEGHPDDPAMLHALEELSFFAEEVCILGVYPAHAFRRGG
jgi:prephenate dehydratase